MYARRITTVVAVALAGALAVSGCARQISPSVHEGRTVGETIRTHAGVIQSVRVVHVEESETLEGNTTGGLLGGVTGGAIGSRFGQGWGKVLAVAGGAVAGAFVGAVTERELKRQPALEYVVRTDYGELLTIVQGTSPQLQPGQRVYVQESTSGRGRVIPAT